MQRSLGSSSVPVILPDRSSASPGLENGETEDVILNHTANGKRIYKVVLTGGKPY